MITVSYCNCDHFILWDLAYCLVMVTVHLGIAWHPSLIWASLSPVSDCELYLEGAW